MFRHSLLATATLGLTTLFLHAASAEVLKLGANLSGAEEVPAVQTPGNGRADITLDIKTNLLSWNVTYSGLKDSVVAAHFHGPADRGANAPVIVNMTAIRGGDAPSKLSGAATLTPDQVRDVLAGKWYVNVHTKAHPPGGIRGQIQRLP